MKLQEIKEPRAETVAEVMDIVQRFKLNEPLQFAEWIDDALTSISGAKRHQQLLYRRSFDLNIEHEATEDKHMIFNMLVQSDITSVQDVRNMPDVVLDDADSVDGWVVDVTLSFSIPLTAMLKLHLATLEKMPSITEAFHSIMDSASIRVDEVYTLQDVLGPVQSFDDDY